MRIEVIQQLLELASLQLPLLPKQMRGDVATVVLRLVDTLNEVGK